MALAVGTRIGGFEITGLLGVGGMGEVYRARDTKLDRDVAIKVLPESFAQDPERVARFSREAKTLASLNHSNIGGIHGLQEFRSAESSDSLSHALILELIDGETLADRIARGPIPLDDALPIAKQITDALEAAHEQGIIHRDLKPANIKVRDDGTVKVLDFGLAKAVETGAGSREPGAAANSPTITSPALMTGIGVLLGTAAYMSPEQAKGRAADKRSDLWSLGCVLYEMLAGVRPFHGEDVGDTLAAVRMRDPDWSRLPSALPTPVLGMLEGLLERDRRRRIGDVAAVLFAIDQAMRVTWKGAEADAFIAAGAQRTLSKRRVAVIATLASAAGLVAGSSVTWYATRPDPPRLAHFPVLGPGATPMLALGLGHKFAISPDGSLIAYMGMADTRQLLVRARDALESKAVVTRGAPSSPFFSPDGQWIGFADSDTSTLRKVAVSGGPAVVLCRIDGGLRGAAWSTDGTIIFSTSSQRGGLLRVSDAGGPVEILTTPDGKQGESAHAYPRLLPDGEAVLFTIRPLSMSRDESQVALLDLHSGAKTIVVRGATDARYVPTGHLVYGAGSSLRAVGFDVNRRVVVGSAVPVLDNADVDEIGSARFDVAADGTLVYSRPLGANQDRRTLVWVDRQGREQPIAAEARAYQYPRISPDGRRIAIAAFDQQQDILLWDVSHATLSRFTIESTRDTYPVWARDGRRLIFSSDRDGTRRVYSQTLDGGSAEALSPGLNSQDPYSVSPDGAWLVTRSAAKTSDMALVSLITPSEERPLLPSGGDATRRNGEISPDGRWIAYQSNESGIDQIHVRRFPDASRGHAQVTAAGGTRPAWSRSGDELFYLAANGALMSVRVEPGDNWTTRAPVQVLEGRYYFGEGTGTAGRTYDVLEDGKRFLMIKEEPTATETVPLLTVLNWTEELKRLVPTRSAR